MRARIVFALVMAAALFCGASLAYQRGKIKEDPNVRAVQGTVTDAKDNPAAGAVVQLKNTKTLQVRSFITQDTGRYTFQGLSVNVDYELKAQRGNEESPVKTLSVFDGRRQPIINLKLQPK